MYRIAVIQNEVEMQHSGYVDCVPKYKEHFDLKVDHVFNRFTSVNIKNLFKEGEDYLLEYDCLIIGTNATSDEYIYNVLREEKNKSLLSEYINFGKGLLICSQKKLKKIDKTKNIRKTDFLPERYEYTVQSRNKEENSYDGNVNIFESKDDNIASYILNFPNNISDDLIKNHCENNDFQCHFYRDHIIPQNSSAYNKILIDTNRSRNVLMVAVPQKNEKIVISTMALDWAGHYELIENIINYIMIGLPELAFVNKDNAQKDEFNFLISEAETSKISFSKYNNLSELNNSFTKKYHYLYALSPAFSEDDVYEFWNKYIKSNKKSVKLFYYKYINSELVLVNFSLFSYVDSQKKDVQAWLSSKYSLGLWENSFWKTYDVLIAMHKMDFDISPFISGVFDEILETHYKSGSYDGVLAPTCGLLELFSIISSNNEYNKKLSNVETLKNETIDWLINKYNSTSIYNKKFIIRAFYRAGLLADLINELEKADVNYKFNIDLREISLNDTSSNLSDKSEIDLCLDIEVGLIYNEIYNQEHRIEKKVKDCINLVLNTQQQNGKWDNNLGKTARIILFFTEHASKISSIKPDLFDKVINLGISALKKSYSWNNWDNNLVTTSNAITAIVTHDKNARYRSKDFLDRVNKEVTLSSSYNSLSLALETIGKITDENVKLKEDLKDYEITKKELEDSKRNLKTSISITSFSVLLLISYYVFLALKNNELFLSMLTESLMWVPIVIGIAITALITYSTNIFIQFKKIAHKILSSKKDK